MATHADRSVRSLLIAAAAFAGATCIPASALAKPALEAVTSAAAASTVEDAVSRAADLVQQGEFVRARALLVELSRGDRGLSLTPEQSKRVYELARNADRQLRNADRSEIDLQNARFALSRDDLVEAERRATAVQNSPRSTDAQREAAGAVELLVRARRADLAPLASKVVDRAVADFDAGNYAEAKDALDRVRRAGVKLDRERTALLARYQRRIVDLELAQGESFRSDPVSLSMFAGEPGDNDWIVDEVNEPGEVRVADTADQPEPIEGITGEEVDAFVAVFQPDVHEIDPNEAPDYPAGQPSAQPSNDSIDDIWDTAQPTDSDDTTSSTQPTPVTVDVVQAAGQIEARRLLSEAERALAERRLNEARNRFEQVLTTYRSSLTQDEISRAEDGLAEARVQLQAQVGPEGNILDQAASERELAYQRTVAEFENRVAQANDALSTGDTDRARTLASEARLTLNDGRDVMPQPEYEARSETVDNLINTIDQTEEEIRIREAEQREAERSAELAEEELERREQREREIVELLERVRALQLEQKYDEALQVVDQILFLDANNPAGLLLKDIIQDTIIYREYYSLKKEKDLGIAKNSLDNLEASLLPQDLVAYPDDWPELSRRRLGPTDFVDNPADREVLAALDDTRLPVNFDEFPLGDIIDFIASVTDLNIDVQWQSLEDIGVDPDSPVTLRLSNVPVKTVLDRTLEKVSDPDLPAGWAVIDGILTIASEDVLRRNTVLEIYDVNDLLFFVPNFDGAPDFDLSSALQNVTTGGSGGGGGGGGGQGPFGGGGSSGNTDDIFESEEDRQQELIDIIQANVDPDGWVDTGGDTSTIQELNGNFIITTTPKNHRAIAGLLSKLRRSRALQINVEARFLLVNEDFFEQIGFDLDVYFNADNGAVNFAQQLDPALLPSDFYPDIEAGNFATGGGAQNIRPTGRTITSNAPVLNNGDGGTPFDAVLDQPLIAPNQVGDEYSVIPAPSNSLGLAESLFGGSTFATSILNSSPALGIAGTFLDDIQVDFLVKATQADRRSVTLTAPRLTFTNGQRSFIAVQTQNTFVTSLDPIVSDSAVALNPVLTPVPTGVSLDLQGVVSADRRYVTLNINTAISEIDNVRQIPFTAGAAGGGGGTGGGTGGQGSNASGLIESPAFTTTQINTTSTIPDQGTLLIGGQRVLNETEIETGVPVLSKIPVLNRFFSNRIESTEEQTLMILIKPTILIQNEEEEKNFPGLLDALGQ